MSNLSLDRSVPVCTGRGERRRGGEEERRRVRKNDDDRKSELSELSELSLNE